MILCSYFTKLNNTLYYNHVFPLLGYIVHECHNISCHSILQSPPYVPCTFCWNFHRVTTEKSAHCQKRILAAIAKQQTATYGLFLSPILAAFQKIPNNLSKRKRKIPVTDQFMQIVPFLRSFRNSKLGC